MAVDMKIEVFSLDLFRNLWYELGATSFILPRLKDYAGATPLNTCSDAVFHAVICRRSFFTTLLWGDIYFEYEKFSKTSIDFYLYLQNNMKKFLPYKELNIFDKLFMTCVVVLEMSSACILNSNKMYTYNAPLCWAMYFDTEYKEEFYAEGGWKELETHANSYNARVLTCNRDNKDGIWSARCAFNDAINTEYSYFLTYYFCREKILNSEASCPQCLPLFHAVRMLYGTSDECVNEFQLTEGYLQLILRMLTREELKKVEQDFLQDTEFEAFNEIIDMGYVYIKAKNEGKLDELAASYGGKISFEKSAAYLEEYQIQNTHTYLARLFALNVDSNGTADQCMFCGSNMNDSSKDLKTINDYYVERINSVMFSTQIDGLKDELAKGSFEVTKSPLKEKDDDINKALQLFFSLGAQPLTSYILTNLEKRNKNPCNENDSNVKMNTQKAPESEIKGNTRKKKSKKGKNKNDDKV